MASRAHDTQERLAAIAAIASEYSRGECGRRVALSGLDDGWDALAEALNAIAEQLQTCSHAHTKLESTTATLQHSNSDFEALLSAIPDLLFELDGDGRYLRIWARDPELLAAQEQFLLGRTASEMLPAPAAAEVMLAIAESLRTGQSHGRTIELPLAQGRRWFELSAALRLDSSDEAARVVLLSRDVTERVSATAALRASEQFARAALDALPSPTCVLDESGVILTVNAAWSAFGDGNGAAGVQWLGQNYLDVCDRAVIGGEAAVAAISSGLRSVLQGAEQRFTAEYPCHAVGQERWFQLRACRFPDQQPARILVDHFDISQRKSTERRLLHAQAQAHIGNWELDLATQRLWWSDELFALFELDRTTFGASYPAFLAAIHPEDRDSVHEAYSTSVANRTPYCIQHRLLMPDGRVKFIEERCETEYAGPTGAALRSWGTALDVTDRVQAEQALRRSEGQLRLALEASGLAVWERDLASDAMEVSKEFAALLGCAEQQPLVKSYTAFLERVHPDDRPALSAAFAACMERQSDEIRVDFRIGCADGRWHWLQTCGRVMEAGSGRQPARMIGTLANIDVRKATELQTISALHQKELLLREVHHRVKNNLQIISSLLHFHDQKLDKEQAHQVFRGARDRLRSMILVHERLYQGDAGGYAELSEYVAALVRELCSAHAMAGPSVRVKAEPVGRLAIEVVLPIGMLVNELVTNALKHGVIDGGEPMITIGVARQGDEILLTVTDNGPGIPAAAYRGESASYGLKLVQHLVRQLRATCEFSSAAGTVVAVRVPVVPSESARTSGDAGAM